MRPPTGPRPHLRQQTRPAPSGALARAAAATGSRVSKSQMSAPAERPDLTAQVRVPDAPWARGLRRAGISKTPSALRAWLGVGSAPRLGRGPAHSGGCLSVWGRKRPRSGLERRAQQVPGAVDQRPDREGQVGGVAGPGQSGLRQTRWARSPGPESGRPLAEGQEGQMRKDWATLASLLRPARRRPPTPRPAALPAAPQPSPRSDGRPRPRRSRAPRPLGRS